MGGFSAKGKSSNEGWGLGLLLVFFPEEEDKYIDKKKKLCSASSSSFKSTARSCSNSNLLFTRAQSTISICALIVFFTLLLFTLCTFEPTVSTHTSSPNKIELGLPRRWLAEKNYKDNRSKQQRSSSVSSSLALQGMGTLFRRGTKAMNDLIVAHLTEDNTDDEIRLFIRTLHRSGLTARADVIFIFPSPLVSPNFSTIIQQENESFLKLVHHYRKHNDSSTMNSFDVARFIKPDKKEKHGGGGEPLWGRRIHSNYSNTQGEEENYELSWGSVVGFEAAELDPEDSLSGFLDHVSIRLRRWACYPMLLGRIRRNFKQLLLVDVKEVVVLGDALVHLKNGNAESVYLWTTEKKHSRRNSEKTKEQKSVTADVIMGGIRGVRRLSNAMLNEIVRAAIATQHKSKNSISDSAILSQLVRNDSLLKNININIVTSESSIPETSSLVSTDWPSLVVRHGNRNVDFNSIILRGICSSTWNSSSVYRDC